MSRDEIREITQIVGDDERYKHFVRRINKEFTTSDEDRNSKVYTLYIEDEDSNRVGFCVIGESKSKMKVWGDTFLEERWVDDSFKMDTGSFELMYMYVQPKWRAKGYAETLFNKATNFTRKKNVDTIYAYVSDRTPTALEFYKKMKAYVIQDFSDEELSSAFLSWRLQD